MPKERKDLLNRLVSINEIKRLRAEVRNLQRAPINIPTTEIDNFNPRRYKSKPIFFSNLPNTNVTYPEVVEEEVTSVRIPTIHVFEFLESTPVQSGQQSSILQYRNDEWSSKPAPNLRDEFGLGQTSARIRSIESRNNIIWLLRDTGSNIKLIKSSDAGDTWESFDGPEGFQKYLQYDASGKLWLLIEVSTDDGFFVQVYRDDTGIGDDFELIYQTGMESYLSDSSWWGPIRALACHPTDPDIIAFIFSEFDFGLYNVAITTDAGETWNIQALDGHDPDFAIAFASGHIEFSSLGRLFVAYDTESPEEPHNHIHWCNYSDNYSSFTSVQPLGPSDPSFGFTNRITISKDGTKIFTTFVHDLESEFNGLRTYLSYSNNSGVSYEILATFDQPSGELNDMPGYPEGLWYDEVNEQVWIFFTVFDFDSEILAISDTFQQRVDLTGSKSTDLNSFIAGLTGLTAPSGIYCGVIS